MKIVEEEHYIPAKTYTSKKYIAIDGKEFGIESDCLRYEKQLEIQNHPVYATAIEDIYTFEDDYCAKLFHISSQEDYDFFVETQGFGNNYFTSDFDKYGAGWYLFYYIDGGDYLNFYHLINYETYIKELDDRFKSWKSDMYNKMNQAINNYYYIGKNNT